MLRKHKIKCPKCGFAYLAEPGFRKQCDGCDFLINYRLGLGDRLAKILAPLQIPQRFQQWFGRDCGCSKRQQQMNRMGDRIARFFRR